eukprot:m.110529 g.110529  ORF g.110529 m.110529 type:complete len:800 (+) comp21311_c0_seq2:272-2671(+)
MASKTALVIPFEDLRVDDVAQVGGKNSSLGEMISQLASKGVRVPGGFATTAHAFRVFLAQGGLDDKIYTLLEEFDVGNVERLVVEGAKIRKWIVETPFPPELIAAITTMYEKLVTTSTKDMSFAIRSSATAEDLPDASFAGQQETFLNIVGLDNTLQAIKEVFASLYNDRAIAYRIHKGFRHRDVALSAGIQQMIRSDLGAAGVIFTLDTESGFRDAVFVTSSYGVGETIVQGAVNPDEFYVHKPMLEAGKLAIVRRNLGSKLIKMVFTEDKSAGRSLVTQQVPEAMRTRFSLTDEEVMELSRYAVTIEKHYGRPMDIEWGKDGNDNKLYILQARPETVQSQITAAKHEKYQLKTYSKRLTSGRAIGQKIGVGKVRIVLDAKDMDQVQKGDVLVADMTDPNWEPVMKRAAAVVTNRGGRTCHAAIIARELGIPAICGCGHATDKLKDGDLVTVSCTEGDTGYVYTGALDYEVITHDISAMPELPVEIKMNVGNPEMAFQFSRLPNSGVGLARIEFIINNVIGIHPKAILELDHIPRVHYDEIMRRSQGYASPQDFFIDKLAEGVSTIAAAFWPNEVIVRLSDYKSNEYRKLLCGEMYEPTEENPMLGFRGASRYVAESFRGCFDMECKAMVKVRETMGLTNVQLMVPFVRTVGEGKAVINRLAEDGLKQGENGLKVMMMCEIPSNCLLADEFLKVFDGFSIGSNDLTQLTLGLDRDSGLVANLFDERDPAVKMLLSMAISACKRTGKYVGICGQGPSDHIDLAQWLMEQGISSMSLNPDTVVDTWTHLAEVVAAGKSAQ